MIYAFIITFSVILGQILDHTGRTRMPSNSFIFIKFAQHICLDFIFQAISVILE